MAERAMLTRIFGAATKPLVKAPIPLASSQSNGLSIKIGALAGQGHLFRNLSSRSGPTANWACHCPRTSAFTQPLFQFDPPGCHRKTKYGSNGPSTLRHFITSTRKCRQVATSDIETSKRKPREGEAINMTRDETAEDEQDFRRSDKAAQAAQINLSAKLSKEGKQQGNAGLGEILRLIKVARPEIRWLGIAFVFLVISSSVTMSIPFSVGRILDLATSGEAEDVRLFGLTLNQFFVGLGTILTLGAMANFGRVVLLRIVGERVVARLRSQLYRRTYVQDAEFFDANRVGDLISRLSSDTVIVGKSVTQNLSDGLRALFSGGAGFAIMVSPLSNLDLGFC